MEIPLRVHFWTTNMHEARCASINHGYSRIPRKRGTLAWLDHRWTAWEEASTPIERVIRMRFRSDRGIRKSATNISLISLHAWQWTWRNWKSDDLMIFNNFMFPRIYGYESVEQFIKFCEEFEIVLFPWKV